MVRARDGTPDVSHGVLELSEHDMSHGDVNSIIKVEGEVDGGASWCVGRDPILLNFSVRDLAVRWLTTRLYSKESLSNGSSNEVSLKLGNLVGDLIDLNLSLSSDLLIALTNLLLLLVCHSSLHFLGLWEVRCRDRKSKIPVGHPLVTGQTELSIFLIEHLSAAILHDAGCVVALEGVEDALVIGVSCHLVDYIVEVV